MRLHPGPVVQHAGGHDLQRGRRQHGRGPSLGPHHRHVAGAGAVASRHLHTQVSRYRVDIYISISPHHGRGIPPDTGYIVLLEVVLQRPLCPVPARPLLGQNQAGNNQ